LSEAAITSVLHDNVDFTENTFAVQMSSGPDYPVIDLMATEFRPLKPDFLDFEYVISDENTGDGLQTFFKSYAPPIGLKGVDPRHLRKICQDHIKSIINRERSVGEASYGDTSIIAWEIFEALNRYRRSNPENGNVSHLSKTIHGHVLTVDDQERHSP
jgi:hypothetical protein